jgi:Zn-finger nucleic acid-binding protein
MPSLDIGVAKAPFLIERCATCHGIFFDRGELEALLEREVQNVPSIDHPRLNELIEGNPSPIDAKVQYWKCPVCQVLMNRASYGQRSGVVAHSCRNHGVWLEAGSLQRLLQWRKAGGELLNAQVKREEREFQAKNDARKAEYRREMDEQLSAASMMGGSSGTGGRYRRNQQGLVLDSLVESIVRLFVK